LKTHVRFLFVKLLIKKGVNDQEILKLLSVLPDFDKDIAKLHLQHLRNKFRPDEDIKPPSKEVPY